MDEKLAHTIPSASKASDTGRTKIYEAISKGELRAKKLGRRTLILDDDLRSWLSELPDLKLANQRTSTSDAGDFRPEKETAM